MFTAGDTQVVTGVLQKLAAMRSYMRDIALGRDGDPEIAAAVGMTGGAIEQMYRLLAIAKYDDRYVIPKAHCEEAHSLEEMGCSVNFDDDPSLEGSPFSESSGRPVPVTRSEERRVGKGCRSRW